MAALCAVSQAWTRNSWPSYSIHQLTSVGIVPQQQRILVVKGAIAPRAAYEPICARIIEVDTPGATAISRNPGAYRWARKDFYEFDPKLARPPASE